MKEFGVNYVHQESKTIPDANYTFETFTKPAPNKCSDFIKAQTPPTHKDVLLKTWAQDTEKMAEAIIEYDDMRGGYFHHQIGFGDAKRFTPSRGLAVSREIAYLNSAAEQKGATK